MNKNDGRDAGVSEPKEKAVCAKIEEIRQEFMLAGEPEIAGLCEKYRGDSRKGVQNLILKYQKQQEKIRAELIRLEGMRRYEDKYAEYRHICGIDEVGRGPLAGPVVAGAVILPKDCRILYLNEVNILNATYEAMRKAIGKLSQAPDILLNDAVTIPGAGVLQVPIVKGDAKSVSIAAASVVAKVTRDRLMQEYDKILPGYGFAENKGYGSQAHIEALSRMGPTPIHRRSFIKNFMPDRGKLQS